MAHGDDKGLNLPPKLAPIQVVIVPIIPKEEFKSMVLESVDNVKKSFDEDTRVYVDDRDNLSPGFKFNEWELKGVPLRIEIGPRDIENNSVVVSRRDGEKEKISVSLNELNDYVQKELADIQNKLLESSQKFRESNTVHVDSYDDLISTLNDKPGFVSCYWHENSEQEDEVKNLTKGTLRCYVIDNDKLENSVNEPSQKGKLAIFSKAY